MTARFFSAGLSAALVWLALGLIPAIVSMRWLGHGAFAIVLFALMIVGPGSVLAFGAHLLAVPAAWSPGKRTSVVWALACLPITILSVYAAVRDTNPDLPGALGFVAFFCGAALLVAVTAESLAMYLRKRQPG